MKVRDVLDIIVRLPGFDPAPQACHALSRNVQHSPALSRPAVPVQPTGNGQRPINRHKRLPDAGRTVDHAKAVLSQQSLHQPFNGGHVHQIVDVIRLKDVWPQIRLHNTGVILIYRRILCELHQLPPCAAFEQPIDDIALFWHAGQLQAFQSACDAIQLPHHDISVRLPGLIIIGDHNHVAALEIAV